MKKKSQDVFYQAQAILSRRDHSSAEVKSKLRRQGFTAEEVAKAITFLQGQNLLDDARFARAYVQNMLSSKPVGLRYLRAKLRQKWVEERIINEVLQEKGKFAVELAKQATEQWKRLHPKHSDDRVRLYRFLISRGFTSPAGV